MSKKLFDLYIDNMTLAANVIDKIIPVVRAYDDKNCGAAFVKEVNKAIENETVTFSVDTDEEEVHFYLDFANTAGLPEGYERECILKEDVKRLGCYLSSFELDEFTGNVAIHAMWVTEALLRKQADLRTMIKYLNRFVEQVLDYYTKRLESIKREIETMRHYVPYQIKDIYGLELNAYWGSDKDI